MKYVIEIDDATGASTLQIGDHAPVSIRKLDLNLKRDPVVDEKKTAEDAGFVHYDAGPIGQFTVSAEIDYRRRPR